MVDNLVQRMSDIKMNYYFTGALHCNVSGAGFLWGSRCPIGTTQHLGRGSRANAYEDGC